MKRLWHDKRDKAFDNYNFQNIPRFLTVNDPYPPPSAETPLPLRTNPYIFRNPMKAANMPVRPSVPMTPGTGKQPAAFPRYRKAPHPDPYRQEAFCPVIPVSAQTDPNMLSLLFRNPPTNTG